MKRARVGTLREIIIDGEGVSSAKAFVLDVLLTVDFIEKEVNRATEYARDYMSIERPERLEKVSEKYCEKLLEGPKEFREALKSESHWKRFWLRIEVEA